MLMPSIFGENLFDEMMDSFNDEFFGKRNPLYGKNASRVMKTDIKEVDGRYVIDIDLPGFKKMCIRDRIKGIWSPGPRTVKRMPGIQTRSRFMVRLRDRSFGGRFVAQEKLQRFMDQAFAGSSP